MRFATEIENVPKLDRAKIRRLREKADLSLDQCVQNSCLEDFWRLIESDHWVIVDCETINEIADQLECSPAELIYPTGQMTKLSGNIEVFDSDVPSDSTTIRSYLRILIETDPGRRSSQMTFNSSEGTLEENQNIWEMVTKGVTA